ncbi:MAG: hypothetical protein Q4C95_05445 [Planctomycetia bacterium]|nr:hypothetical protein [Planctomycetia bacterium]
MKKQKTKWVAWLLLGIMIISVTSFSGCHLFPKKENESRTVGDFLADEKPSW